MKIISRLIMLGILAVMLAGCGGNKELVQNGYLEIDKSITIKQALDGYKDFNSVSWQEIETANGRQVVQVYCALSDKVVDFYSRYNDAKSMGVCIQFVINHDKTFDFSYMGYEIFDGDQTKEEAIGNPFSKLQNIYSNNSWL